MLTFILGDHRNFKDFEYTCFVAWLQVISMNEGFYVSDVFLFCFVLFYYSYVHTMFESFLPPAPTRSITTHFSPSLSPLPPQYPAETILPLSRILMKREYKQ
jgi:hypothetical protein